MYITVKVEQKLLRQFIGYYLDYHIYYNYDNEIIKEAGVPKREEAIDLYLANDKFMVKVQKVLQDTLVTEQALESLYDNMLEFTIPETKRLIKVLDKMQTKAYQAEEEQEERDKLTTTIDFLVSRGYTVTKAPKQK